jgi:hypothetical protein
MRRTDLLLISTFQVVLLLTVCNAFAQEDTSRIRDANSSHLFIAPTARSLPADSGYINLAGIIFPNFGYGITDEFMVRGGLTPIVIDGHLLYFGLASLQVAHYGDLDISGGIILTDLTGYSRHWENTLYGFGIISYGSDDLSVHAGFGGGYSGARESNSAVFMLGAEWKIARTTKIITENWIIPESGSSVYSLGVRIYGKSLIGELGAVVITTNSNLTVGAIVPWLGLTFVL